MLAVTIALVALVPLAWMQDANVDTLSRHIPAGAVLAIEAQDFGTLLDTWNNAPEKAAWLDSDSYATFSRSKLFLRLKEAQTEFAAAISLPLDLTQLEAIAGGESVVALYDIGELRLLYITELSRSVALETALLRSRLELEPRRSADVDYWVHTDSDSGRELAFAVAGNRLFIATDDSLLGQALELQANQGERALTNEPWYPTHGPRGDVRLIENLRTLVLSPHFRSYWIQGNITELSAYESGVADLFLEDTGLREHRRLVRLEPSPPIEPSAGASLADLAPLDAPFHRSWNRPTADAVVTLLAQKLLSPGDEGETARYQVAPLRPHFIPQIGGNLEARIDTPPASVSQSSLDRGALQTLAASVELQGLLHVQTSSITAGLVRFPNLVGVLAASPWDDAVVLGALQTSVSGLWTTSGAGTEWQSRGSHYALTGLRDLFVVIQGELLLVADSEALLVATLNRLSGQQPNDSQAMYRAHLEHSVQTANYTRVMAHLDFLEGRNSLQTPREPALFTDSIGSLSGALGRVTAIDIERYDRGSYVEETIRYNLP
jgi:hypothetical protein